MTTAFGCFQCYGEDAAAVAAYYRSGGLQTEREVVDQSHFIVSVRRCRECGQAFVSIFTEFVDWVGGDDPQYRDLVPVTPEEAATVIAQRGADLGYLGSLGADRRRLSMDWPGGAEQRTSWKSGTFGVREGH